MPPTTNTATARAYSNIAFIKYWGNKDHHLRIPASPSLSMNLDGIYTETTLTWDISFDEDTLTLNGVPAEEDPLVRLREYLTLFRKHTGIESHAHVESQNNFPMGAGIASSASAFAAVALAASAAARLRTTEQELTTLARLGSGSASRSIPGGFVEWHDGYSHETSFAESIAPPEHWELVDVIAIISSEHKAVTSSAGHQSATTSDLQVARIAGAHKRFRTCKQALLERDFATFAEVVEHDSNLMHAVMMTSRPPLFYWLPTTLTIMEHVRRWRSQGLQVCYTLDAGPNVHCICIRKDAEKVSSALKELSGVRDILIAEAGGPAHIIEAKTSYIPPAS